MSHRTSTRCVRPASPRRGFTLVELLVVIGIIALLISILLPSLGKARRSAQTVKCLSNLHQIGLMIAQYTISNKGTLPYGYWNGNATNWWNGAYDGNHAADWTTLLAHQMSGRMYNSEYAATPQTTATSVSAGGRGMFICPSVNQDTFYPNILSHYTCHPRLMPTLGTQDGDPRDGGWGANMWMVPWKISMIHNAQQMGLIFDAAIAYGGPSNMFPGSWSASANAYRLDAWRIYSSTFLTSGYNLDPQPWMNGDASVDLTGTDKASDFNNDTPGNLGNVRFRHGSNNIMNSLFVDGHAGSFTLSYSPGQTQNQMRTDFKRRNINVDYRSACMKATN